MNPREERFQRELIEDDETWRVFVAERDAYRSGKVSTTHASFMAAATCSPNSFAFGDGLGRERSSPI